MNFSWAQGLGASGFEGFQGFGFRGLGFRGLGCWVWGFDGFLGSGFRGLGVCGVLGLRGGSWFKGLGF